MNAEELKSLQAPLKQKYKDQPETAIITLKANARIGEGITCKVETGAALVEAGLHPATGGDGLSLCSGDMLLDFRGTLGVSKEASVGFQCIRLHFDLESDANQEQLESLIKLTERYCVVYQTISSTPTISITY